MTPREMRIIRECVARFIDDHVIDMKFCPDKLLDPNSVVSQELELKILRAMSEDDEKC